jgi:hypothetical protein
MEEKKRMKIQKPRGDAIPIHEAQVQLCLCIADIYTDSAFNLDPRRLW